VPGWPRWTRRSRQARGLPVRLACRRTSRSRRCSGHGGLCDRGCASASRVSAVAALARRARARDLLCLAGLVLSALYGFAMIPLTPGLIATRPVLLELLSGSTSSVVAAGAFSEIESKLQLTVVVAAAVPGMMKFDCCSGGLACCGGTGSWRCSPGAAGAPPPSPAGRATGLQVRRDRVLLSPFLPVPTPLVYAAAGWAGLRLIPFVVCDLIGSAAWAALLAVLGSLLGTSGVTAANLVSRYALITMIVLAAIAIVPHAWHVLSARRRAAE